MAEARLIIGLRCDDDDFEGDADPLGSFRQWAEDPNNWADWATEATIVQVIAVTMGTLDGPTT